MKTLHIFSILLFLLSFKLSGQIRGTVEDKSNENPIQFANIFLKGKPIGATTDKNGYFEIPSGKKNDTLIISAIGYDTQSITGDTLTIKIKMIPKTYELPDIVVKPQKHDRQLRIGTYNNKKINQYFACGGYPWIVTKYFGYKPEYSSTPYLKLLKIMTSANSQDSVIFNLRLYSVNEDGSPGVDLLNKNIIVKTFSGRNKNTTIDLSPYRLTFPPSGLIIAVEWLIIDQNKSTWKYQLQYLPQFGSVTMEGESKTWIYVGGKWLRTTLMPPTEKNKYKELAAELTLTN